MTLVNENDETYFRTEFNKRGRKGLDSTIAQQILVLKSRYKNETDEDERRLIEEEHSRLMSCLDLRKQKVQR